MEIKKNPFAKRTEEIAEVARERELLIKKLIEQFPEEIVQLATENVLKEIINEILKRKKCPLIHNQEWDCSPLSQGNESWCNSAEHINCPSFEKHLLWRLTQAMQRKKNQKRKIGK